MIEILVAVPPLWLEFFQRVKITEGAFPPSFFASGRSKDYESCCMEFWRNYPLAFLGQLDLPCEFCFPYYFEGYSSAIFQIIVLV